MIERHRGYLRVRQQPAPAASQQLEAEGYAVLKHVFNEAQIAALAAEIQQVFDDLPPDRTQGRDEQTANMFRYAMLNQSGLSQQAIGHPGILEVIEPLLGEDCHVIANTAWHNPPSSDGRHGGEAWHTDAGPHIPLLPGQCWPEDIPHPVFAIGAHIFLKPCGLQDGPTGVIPRSHLSGLSPPPEQLMDNELTHAGQGVIPLQAEAGDVALFVSDVWHRRMPSQPGDRGRFFLQAHYARRDIAQRLQTTDVANHLSEPAIQRAASPRSKTLVGLHKPLFYDG